MIDVAFTPAAMRRCDVAVVVDVLRATSTVTQALAAGYRCVLCAESLDRARTLRSPARALAGEQDCITPADFDLGNSPVEATRRSAAQLVLASTNGAPTIVAAARNASTVLVGSLLNLEALLSALEAREADMSPEVQLICAGSAGAVALEDAYVAGRISARLTGKRSDAARVAEIVAASFETSLEALSASAHAAALVNAGFADDVAYCARESELGVVPGVAGTSAGVAMVVDVRNTVGDMIDADAVVTSSAPAETASSA